MAPAKRARPSFSPPRPGKSRHTSKSNPPNNRSSKGITKKQPTKNAVTGRSKGRSSVIALVDTEANAEDDEAEDDEEEEEDEEPNDSSDTETTSSQDPQPESSPEPSVILAEVTHEEDAFSDHHSIPVALIHRILHHNFQNPDKTKMSTDARRLVSRYIETFVREAIARSSFENQERVGDVSGAGGGGGVGSGWLEVDDLEKSAVQLCLDF